MLNLKLKPGDGFLVGDNIRIVYRRGGGRRISVTIDAPREIRVLREKLLVEPVAASVDANPQRPSTPKPIEFRPFVFRRA